MNRDSRRGTHLIAALTVVACAAGVSRADEAERLARLDPVTRHVVKSLPVEWAWMGGGEAAAEMRNRIAERLGAELTGLANVQFRLMGKPVQVNTLRCATPADAAGVHAKLLQSKGGRSELCLLLDDCVIEFVCGDVSQAVRGMYDLGLRRRPESPRFRVTVVAAPVASTADYMQWNACFNALHASPTGTDADAPECLKQFQFADTLKLRMYENGTIQFNPKPADQASVLPNGTAAYRFESLPRAFGAPVVRFEAVVTPPRSRPESRTGGALAALTRPNRFWPSELPAVRSLADSIAPADASPREFVRAALAWLQPGRNIRFGGGVTGSRYGVETVLNRRQGHCWDFSDLFITLCRARGVPARQVAGWVYGGEGHVWAEVLLDGEWMQVDATGGGELECWPYHIGLATIEDGEMPLFYLEMPKLEMLADAP
jgi:hypothetical protein